MEPTLNPLEALREHNARVLAGPASSPHPASEIGTPPPVDQAPTVGLGLPTQPGGDFEGSLLLAEEHHRLKCPKCDHVQSASNKVCSNCGHDLSEARKAKFAKLGMDNPQADLLLGDKTPPQRLASFHAQLDLAEAREDDGLVWKALCKTGELALSPGPGQTDLEEPLVLSNELFEHLHTSVVEQAFPYVTVPTSHLNGLLENSGYVKKTKIVDSTNPADPPGTKLLMGGIEFTDPDVKARVLNGSIPDTSVGVKFGYRNKRTGKLYPAALEHVALTHQPWVDGLPAFGALSQEQKTFEPVPDEEKETFAGVYMSAETAKSLNEDGDILSSPVEIDGIPAQFFSTERPRRQMKHTRRTARQTEKPTEGGKTVEQLLASQTVAVEEANRRAEEAEARAERAEALAGSSAQAIHMSAVQAKAAERQGKGYTPALVAVCRDLELAAGPRPAEVTEENATLTLSQVVPATEEGGTPTTETVHLSVADIVDRIVAAVPVFGKDPSVQTVMAGLDELHASQEPTAQEKTSKEKAEAIREEMQRRGPGAGMRV